ncbi:hypothetical protein [Aureimonas sp. AU12]|uniref:hypothetical protein n=1 Tax=Aureimonas sp. AU12 TaxID=1638161 RepID=UPI000785BC75|nr:hypothetical protein [Aureimonas sp. AU12]
MTIWQPGMRCVCVSAGRVLYDLPLKRPVKGNVYTVRAVDTCALTGAASLLLDELDNRDCIERVVRIQGQAYRLGVEPAYLASLFRPLSETRLDQFRQHLAPTPRRKADA